MNNMETLRYMSGAAIGFFIGVQAMKVGNTDIVSYVALAAMAANLYFIYRISKLKLEIAEEKKINKKFNEK